MFAGIIQECRALIEGNKKKSRKNKDLDERPEMSVGSAQLPLRGAEGTYPYGNTSSRNNTQVRGSTR